MADIITVTIPELPALGAATGDEEIAVWQGERLSRIRQAALRGSRTFSGDTDPPSQPSEIMALAPVLYDRWRNRTTGDEWQVTSLDPFTWFPDGNLRGTDGASTAPGPPGAPGQPGASGPEGPSGRELQKSAAVAIPNWRVVYLQADDRFGLCDNTVPSLRQTAVGIVATGGSAGDLLTAHLAGEVLGPPHGLPLDSPVFVGPEGILLAEPPVSGWYQTVGKTVASNYIVVALGEAELIQTGPVPISTQGYAYPSTTEEIETGLSIAGFLSPLRFKPILDRILDLIDGLLNRNRTAVDFGAVADGVATIGGDGYSTATGTDNTNVLNAYAIWCRDNSRPFILPPGGYLITQTITVWTDVQAAGARLIMRYAPDAIAVSVETLPGDETAIPLAEVQSWTGWRRRGRRLGGLSGRRGEYIAIDTTNQIQINRVGSSAIRFGEGFRVADDSDVLAHTLFGTADNANWTTGTFVSKKIRPLIVIEGLTVVIAKPPGTVSGIFGSGVSNKRCSVHFKGCEIDNRSGLQVAQGFVDESVCDVIHEAGFVKGLQVVNTNYGWNSNLSAGLAYNECREEYCRRGIDAHKSKHIDITNCELPDGWGTHYAWWMRSVGGTLGASTANNPQVLNLAGGGFSCTGAQISVTKAADTVVRIRSDLFECGDGLRLTDCDIVIDSTSTGPTLLGVQGPTAGFDFGRAIEVPRLLKCTGNTIEVRGVTTVLRAVQWLLTWDATAFPQAVLVNSRWKIEGNTILFPDTSAELPNGGPVLPNGALRVEIQANKPATAAGTGIVAAIADLPVLSLATSTPAAGNTTTARFSGRLERIDGLVFYKWVYGAYSQVMVDAGSLSHSVVSGTTSTPVGGESILPSFRTGLMVSATEAGFALPNGVPLVVVDTPGMANRVSVTGGATGVSPKLQAFGSDANVGFSLATRGSGAFDVLTSFTTRQFLVAHTADAVNWVTATGGIDAGDCLLTVGGTGATGHLALGARGSAGVVKSQRQFQLANVALVASPPAGPVAAGLVYFANGRKVGEAAGAGTGVPAYYSNGQWRRFSDDTIVAA